MQLLRRNIEIQWRLIKEHRAIYTNHTMLEMVLCSERSNNKLIDWGIFRGDLVCDQFLYNRNNSYEIGAFFGTYTAILPKHK